MKLGDEYRQNMTIGQLYANLSFKVKWGISKYDIVLSGKEVQEWTSVGKT